MNRFQKEVKRLSETVTDAARIGSREVARSLDKAKQQLETYQYTKRRKELFAELGRELYDASKGDLPEHVLSYFKETEFQEIMSEIEALDKEIQKHKK